jgi:AcrR family transcriptional regulator
MTPRERILETAAELLVRDGDLSTRAVCDAAGVTAPTLYHHFGDKDGLVEAAIAHAYEFNLRRKRARKPTGDPVEDLRRGWNEHVVFAVEHPAFYRLMYSRFDSSAEPPAPARAARGILMKEIAAIARAGRLRVEPELAAEAIHTAVRGVGAMHAAAPRAPEAAAVNALVREAVLSAIAVVDGAAPQDGAAARHALALIELLGDSPDGFTKAEASLLDEWLERLATTKREAES